MRVCTHWFCGSCQRQRREPRKPFRSNAFESARVKRSTSTPYSQGENENQASATTRRTLAPTRVDPDPVAQTLRAACDDACNLALNERILVPDPDPGKLAICPVTAFVGAFWNVAVRASGIRA